MMRLQIIVGSVREGRVAKPVADWAAQAADGRHGFHTEVVDLEDWDLPFFDLARPPLLGDYRSEIQQRWAAKIAEGDAYLFVSPEYNHGYSAVLKNAIDYLYAEWGRKPASFIGYGGVEGARAIEQLRLVLIELHVAPIRDALHLRELRAKLQDGVFAPSQADTDQLDRVLRELSWWAGALAAARASATRGAER